MYERHKRKELMKDKNITKIENILLGHDPRESNGITRASLITNLFLKSKLPVMNFIRRSLYNYDMQSDNNDLKKWKQTIGFCYPTIL